MADTQEPSDDPGKKPAAPRTFQRTDLAPPPAPGNRHDANAQLIRRRLADEAKTKDPKKRWIFF